MTLPTRESMKGLTAMAILVTSRHSMCLLMGRQPFLFFAPRLKVADLKGKSLMIHAGGDNYSDTPAPLGGGGARAACGVVK